MTYRWTIWPPAFNRSDKRPNKKEMKNMKARTMRRFWAVLLCLVMVLGLLPAAALADEGPEMETTVLDITKTVAQA